MSPGIWARRVLCVSDSLRFLSLPSKKGYRASQEDPSSQQTLQRHLGRFCVSLRAEHENAQVAGRRRTFALKDLSDEIDGVKARVAEVRMRNAPVMKGRAGVWHMGVDQSSILGP